MFFVLIFPQFDLNFTVSFYLADSTEPILLRVLSTPCDNSVSTGWNQSKVLRRAEGAEAPTWSLSGPSWLHPALNGVDVSY